MKYIFRVLSEASDSIFRIYVCIFIAFVFIIKITFSIYGFDSNPLFSSYFSDNLLPEITGMIIEMVLFIFVIDVVRASEAAKQEHNKEMSLQNGKIEIEHRLRSQLRALLRRVFEEVELSDGVTGAKFKFHSSEHDENQSALVLLKEKLTDELGSSSFSENLILAAEFELPMMLSLVSVNAELSGRHLKAWMNIIFYLKQISNDSNIQENTAKLIDWIAMFDKFSYQQKLID
ncbi:hypothetical protein [Serratia marcescens]|uniref:hypothetical protein n=1 Tax=Serratia marcescens TaxID=615 RepID=UPI003EE0D482